MSETIRQAVERDGDRATVWLYGPIGGSNIFEEGVTAKEIAQGVSDLKGVREIDVRIHSRGGSVNDGFAIFNALKQHPGRKTVHIDGAALSMASVIAQVGDTIRAPSNAMMMVHKPRMFAIGTAREMETAAGILARMETQIVETYARSKRPEEEIRGWMADGKETWMTAREAKDFGLVDEVTDPLAVAAGPIDLSQFRAAPSWAAEAVAAWTEGSPPTPKETAEMTEPNTPKAAGLAELKKALPGASAEFLISQLEAQATVETALTAFAKTTSDALAAAQLRIDQVNKELAETKAELAKRPAAASGLGVLPLGHAGGPQDGGALDPVAQWNQELAAELKNYNGDRMKATAALVKRAPDLHANFIEAVNRNRPRR